MPGTSCDGFTGRSDHVDCQSEPVESVQPHYTNGVPCCPLQSLSTADVQLLQHVNQRAAQITTTAISLEEVRPLRPVEALSRFVSLVDNTCSVRGSCLTSVDSCIAPTSGESLSGVWYSAKLWQGQPVSFSSTQSCQITQDRSLPIFESPE